MKVAVLGAGSWGTALAYTIARNGHLVWLWNRNPTTIKEKKDDNSRPDNVSLSTLLSAPVIDSQIIIFAIPRYGMREVCQDIVNLRHYDLRDKIFIGTCKGIEEELHFASDIVNGYLEKAHYGHLGGPAFAKGLLAKEQSRLVIASKEAQVIEAVQSLLNNTFLRVEGSDDLIGLQVAGATRTPLSIALGAATALGYASQKNTMAAIFGRALRENARLAVALGGKWETFTDVAGAGDLYLCNDPESRNFRFGFEMIERAPDGLSPQDRITELRRLADEIGTVEGYLTSRALYELTRRYNLEMPWVEAVYRVCHRGDRMSDVIKDLKRRTIRVE